MREEERNSTIVRTRLLGDPPPSWHVWHVNGCMILACLPPHHIECTSGPHTSIRRLRGKPGVKTTALKDRWNVYMTNLIKVCYHVVQACFKCMRGWWRREMNLTIQTKDVSTITKEPIRCWLNILFCSNVNTLKVKVDTFRGPLNVSTAILSVITLVRTRKMSVFECVCIRLKVDDLWKFWNGHIQSRMWVWMYQAKVYPERVSSDNNNTGATSTGIDVLLS